MEHNEPVHILIQNTTFVNDEIAWRFTPKPLRKSRKIISLGHILVSLPCLALFMPLIVIYLRSGEIIKSILLFPFLALVVISSLSLVSFGKQAAISVIANLEKFLDKDHINKFAHVTVSSLLPAKQVVSGVTFSIPIVILAQAAGALRRSNLLVRLSVSISVAYVAFLVGVGFYLVLCIPQILASLYSAKFKLPLLLPYQTVELKRIADTSVSISLLGSVISACLTSLLLGLAILTKGYQSIYWGILMIGVLILSWATISIPFLTSQLLLAHIIKQAKEANLSQLSLSIRKAFKELEGTDKESIELLEKLQSLYDQIYKSPNTILNWSILGRYFSSLLLSIVPSVIGIFLK